MICILALLVFGLLSIFSARYRPLAADAFDCTFRKLTFRKCETGLDTRIKAHITGSIMAKNEKAAGFVFKHFETLSLAFTILFFGSLVYSIYSGYNFIRYGDCYGPVTTAASGFCPYTFLEGERLSQANVSYNGTVVLPTPGDDPSIGPADAKVTVIEFGCLSCPYTRMAEPTVKELINRYGNQIRFVYKDFPLVQHGAADYHAEAARCAEEQGKYWEYREKVLQLQDECQNITDAKDHLPLLKGIAADLGLNKTAFDSCLDSRRYKAKIESDFDAGVRAGVYGTPTFFINNKTIVGPKPIDAFTAVIDEELKK
jgi:protein-disulfide isomerase